MVQIVRGEVHKVFGPDVTAPAKSLPTFPSAVPWSKLSPEEQSKINAQLVQEQLKAATLLTANLGKEVAKEPEDDDPWNTPVPQTPIAEGNANDVQPPEHHVKHVDVPDVSDDVDPWATPLPTPQTDDQEQGQPDGWSSRGKTSRNSTANDIAHGKAPAKCNRNRPSSRRHRRQDSRMTHGEPPCRCRRDRRSLKSPRKTTNTP